MPESFVLVIALSIGCFIIGIAFFRKNNVAFNKVFLSFMLGMYNPFKVKDELRKEGIAFIILGYVIFIVYVALMT